MTKIFTIGHSTRTLNRFIEVLIVNKIKCLIDIRSYPGSKYVPWFNQANLKKKLAQYKIKYYYIPELGGRRRYVNIHHPSILAPTFSSYAEYMMMDPFKKGLKELKKIARHCRSAMMCAEGVYWRCHRRMVSDRLTFDGWDVYHLGIKKDPIPHAIWDIAREDKNGEIIYDQ